MREELLKELETIQKLREKYGTLINAIDKDGYLIDNLIRAMEQKYTEIMMKKENDRLWEENIKKL